MENYTAETPTLTLLTKVGEYSDGEGGGGESRVFRCKTCLKEFSSFQALGGHRASHTKPINNDETQSQSSSTKKAKRMTSHTCPICGIEFPMGQALGGHMRKHRDEKEKVAAPFVTRSFFPVDTSTVTTLKKSSSGKRVACLDLGLDHVESSINLKLELGRTIS